MCPITKESLSIVNRPELLGFFKDKNFSIPDGEKFLINQSQSFLYKFIKNNYPDILPENAIPLEIIPQQKIPIAFTSNTISFDTLKKHKEHLEEVYKIVDTQHNFGRSPKRKKFENISVHTPLANNLVEGSLLDGGGGIGKFREFTKGRLHVNVDVSEERLDRDPSSYKVLGRTEKISIKDESFDNIISARSMEHCQDVQTTMFELVRCLKPGGRFCVCCWRYDWPKCLSRTLWGYTNFFYILQKIWIMAKRDPALLLDRILYKMKLKKHKKDKSFGSLWRPTSRKIFARRFNPDEFKPMLEKTGLKILKQGYCGREFPGPVSPPMFLIERFFDPMKYGLFFFFICEKPSIQESREK